jgi:hypothetical protein
LPPAHTVDVKAELAALREALAGLQRVPDRGKLERAMQDAVEEAAKPEPDKEEVGGAVERVVKYAKDAAISLSTPKRSCRAWRHSPPGSGPPAGRCSICWVSRFDVGPPQAGIQGRNRP